MKSARPQWICPSVITLIFLLSACSKKEAFDDISGIIAERLIDASCHDASIEKVNFNNDGVCFYLSDKTRFNLSYNDNTLITIGLDGYWYRNTSRSPLLVEEDSAMALLSIHPDYHNDETDTMTIIGAIEDYSSWHFVFSSGFIIDLEKKIVLDTSDEIVRGINHRGFNVDAPENTLPAFRLSRLNGFNYVESDVRFTQDNVPVLLHDNTVDRTSNGNGRISDLTFEQVRELDFGSWKNLAFANVRIPSFGEFLTLCSRIDLSPYIELKDGSYSQILDLVKMVKSYGLEERATYISFSYKLLEYIRDADPAARIGYLCGEITDSIIRECESLQSGYNTVFLDSCVYGNESVMKCQQAKIPLEIWTIDSMETILSLPDYISGVTSNCLHAGRVLSGR